MGSNRHPLRFLMLSRISLKLLAATAICVLVILGGGVIYLETQSYDKAVLQLKKEQRLITEGQAVLLPQHLIEDDFDGIFLTLSGALANPNIIGARIAFNDERPPLDVGETDAPLQHSVDITFIAEGSLYKAGKIVTFATTRHLDEQLAERLRNLAMIIGFVLLAIIWAIATSVHLIVGLPLQRIVDALEDSEDGETAVINWSSKDEMGRVVERLNFLHGQLRKRVKGLRNELDSSERLEAERLRNLANATSEGILIYVDDRVIDLNEPMAKLLGDERNQLLKKPLSMLFSWDVLVELQTDLHGKRRHFVDAMISTDESHPVTVEMLVEQFDYRGREARVVVMRDISERLKAEEQIRKMALHDSLTGLPNRMCFMNRMDQALVRVQQHPAQLAVMYVDLDNFKEVNDTMGHAVGDELLHEVSQILESSLLDSDMAGRLGGDEFAVLLEREADEPFDPERLAGRIIDRIAEHSEHQNYPDNFGASIGISIYPDDGLSKSDFLMQADLALYQAKSSGRNCLRLFSEALNSEQKRRTLLAERLRNALEREELELYFQPQATSRDRVVVGFEALLRWSDEELGRVPPQEILHVARQEGLLRQLGKWVLTNACQAAVKWAVPYRIAVNLSPTDITGEDLVGFIKELLTNTGLAADRLEIEISEQVLVDDLEHTKDVVTQLRNLGINIVMDDFGTGYSSLSFLHAVPFDRIKIARAFIQESEQSDDLSEQQATITSMVIDLGRRLNVEIVAEGVETEQQLEFLQAQDCDYVQGYLIGKPMPEASLDHFFDKLQEPLKRAG